jgi:hypothetical protein
MSFFITFCILVAIFMVGIVGSGCLRNLGSHVFKAVDKVVDDKAVKNSQEISELKKEAKNLLASYGSRYSIKNMLHTRAGHYRGTIYCEGYHYGLTIDEVSKEKFLEKIKVAIDSNWWERMGQYPRFVKKQRGKFFDRILYGIFLVCILVIFVSFILQISFSSNVDEDCWHGMSIFELIIAVALVALVLDIIVGIVIGRRYR